MKFFLVLFKLKSLEANEKIWSGKFFLENEQVVEQHNK